MSEKTLILALETSCDDTSVSILKTLKGNKAGFTCLSNIISSQTEIHRKWGGVYPTLAKREHQRNLVPVLTQALKESGLLKKSAKKQTSVAKFKVIEKILEREPVLFKQLKTFLLKYKKPNVDFIATTEGPGLEPALWVGVNFARALSYFWNLKITPVNHIEAHLFANFIDKDFNLKPDALFPAISLIVSGGHTQILLMKNYGKYKILGETRDDAAGECFDKSARILGLGYPGGPAIAKKASQFKSFPPGAELKINLPRPMIHTKDYDLSFSGLKTAVLYNFKSQSAKTRKSKEYITEISKDIQNAIIEVLITKTLRAADEYNAKSIILGGGVAANEELRKQFRLKTGAHLLIPPKILCTDNAAMIGAAGYFHWLKKETKSWKNLSAKANLRIT
ncbi:MAG: tRNA (adenosine(37)-N6)-threonylcarbamoyltransferase complex transferase subunit TsaD [Candidatus Parcubacteria bacterium]|nr:tRNA (adenosine(37)-N6)-threonylcarbamoyltransferase complex transferase subunit TsaD [Candidatus Parcubacteria bacterium]